MENKKFKNIHDQFVEFQKQNALHALKQSIYNYLWINGCEDIYELDIHDVIDDIIKEFYKESE